jgi:multiple sugar transport system permease protein
MKSLSFGKINKKLPQYISKIFIHLLLIGLAFVFLYPFLYMLSTSIKSYNDINNILVKWIPREFNFRNYELAFATLNFKNSFVNSLLVAVLTTIGHVLSCSLIGYGLARYNFRFKGILFAFVIISVIVPVQTIIIPLYLNYMNLHMYDTYLPFIVPSFLGVGLRGGLFTFLFYQYFIKFPKSLEEAAEIDGSSPYKTFFKIAFPAASSVTIVAIVLSVVWHWNDFYEPSIYLSPVGKGTLLPQMLPQMYDIIQSAKNTTDRNLLEMKTKYHEGVIMAGTVLATVFLPAMYLFLQRKFVEGIETSGITGE